MGVSARQIFGIAVDADRQRCSNGGWVVSRNVVCKTFAGAWRCHGVGRGLFHSAEAGVGSCSGYDVFLLHYAIVGDSLYGWAVRCGTLCGPDANSAGDSTGSPDAKIVFSLVLFVAQLRKFRCDGCGRAWAIDSSRSGAAQLAVYRVLLHHRVNRSGTDFFT